MWVCTRKNRLLCLTVRSQALQITNTAMWAVRLPIARKYRSRFVRDCLSRGTCHVEEALVFEPLPTEILRFLSRRSWIVFISVSQMQHTPLARWEYRLIECQRLLLVMGLAFIGGYCALFSGITVHYVTVVYQLSSVDSALNATWQWWQPTSWHFRPEWVTWTFTHSLQIPIVSFTAGIQL